MTTRRTAEATSNVMQDDDAPPASGLSSMQRAILTIQKMRTKIESLERARVEPIAIIGMGCRFPGGANSPEAYFRLLMDGVDAVTEVPPERWPITAAEDSADPVARAVRFGAFLRDVDLFDAGFFSISPREASKMDPQQRLLLEVTWEALERAGQLPERLVNSRTGVFLGIMTNDYAELGALAGIEDEDVYTTTGNGHCFPAGRLSYTFGFQGPSVAVDTACSSSLVALHLACQSLRGGECNMAVAGGVNLMLVPSTTRKFAKLSALSADGRCKTFDATANGFVRGEGCGMLVLKRLSDAEKDGDTILALIRGSAVNQDGRSTGLTTPNVLAQQAMLKQALENARVAPSDVGYVEVHGTGTPLGDPIEFEALKAVLGGPREKGAVCVLGAAKTNIGHLEAAAGVAGIMKVVLALQNEFIPGNLHFRTLNPRIDLRGTTLEIARASTPWKSGMRPRFAGISSFGLSGTNAHVVLEESPRNLEEVLAKEASAYLLPISAKSPAALAAQVKAYQALLASPDSPRLLDIVHTASSRRSHFEHRIAAVGGSKGEIAAALDAYARGEASAGVAQGKAAPARAKVVFVFSGQGSQWISMGKKLYDEESAFRSVIDSCDALLMGRLGWSLLDELDAPESMSRLGETQVAQPLIFAIQIALVELLRSWGIAPDAVIGHNMGEIAAAHIAGILSLDEAIRLVAIRGRIMQKATGLGRMVSVAAPLDVVTKAIAGYEDRVSVTAVNDPASVVLAGETVAMDEVVAKLEREGVACASLRANHALHSPQIEPLAAEFVERLARVDARRATLAMYSTVLSECVEGKELDVRYWGRSVRNPVDFVGAVQAAIHDGYQLFLEIGPHPELVGSIERCLASKKAEGMAVATLERGKDDRRALLDAAGALYTRGCAVEWARLVPAGGKCVALPSYPFRRNRFWIDLPVPAKPQGAQKAGETPARNSGKIAFVFPGQGSQWLGMGRQLLAEEPAFRAILEACDEVIQKESGFSVLAELAADDASSRLGRVEVVQPVLFAIEVALAGLWRAWGVQPDCVVGHSMGEVAAAHVAGILSLADAAKVICRRSRLLERVSGRGAMALVELSLEGAANAIVGFEDRLGVAASNGPRSSVLSGDPAALEVVLSRLEEADVFCRRIKVDVASHCPQVDPLREDLLRSLADLAPSDAKVEMTSTVTTERVNGPELSAAYWVKNLREPVRFSGVVQRLILDGYSVFLEMSPHPILLPSIEENLKETKHEGHALASVRRQSDERRSMLESLGLLESLRQTATRAAPPAGARGGAPFPVGSSDHAWLGLPFETSESEGATLFQFVLSLEEQPWLADHRVGGEVILPGAAFIDLLFAALRSRLGEGPLVAEDLAIMRALVLREGERSLVEVALVPESSGNWTFKLSSRRLLDDAEGEAPSGWQLHATARVGREMEPSPGVEVGSIGDVRARCNQIVPLDDLGRNELAQGIQVGPAFQAIVDLARRDVEALARLRVPQQGLLSAGFLVHPVLLDAALRAALAILPPGRADEARVLAGVRRIRFYRPAGDVATCHATVGAPGGSSGAETSARLLDERGRVVLDIEGIEVRALPRSGAAFAEPFAHMLFEQQWEPAPLDFRPRKDAAAARFLVFCDEGGAWEKLCGMLAQRGADVRRAFRRTPGAPPSRDRVEVDPSDPAAIAALVADAAKGDIRFGGVVYLWGLDAAAEVMTPASLESAFTRGSAGALHVAQAVSRLKTRDKPRLWLVVRGTQMVEAEPRDVFATQAALFGLGRTIAIEAPELRCARVDLDPSRPLDEMQELGREILQDGQDDEIALRAEKRFVGRLALARPSPPVVSGESIVRSDGSYLVTGGLGTLGLLTAEWLASRGAKHLLLQGRRGVSSPAQESAIEAMRASGVDVAVLAVDVVSAEELSAALRPFTEKIPLRGVVHAAGMTESAALEAQDVGTLRRVYAPKVLGGHCVYMATRDEPLDFFVLYSSIVGLLGSVGMANYVAANTFLDAYAHHLRRAGSPATSIAWGFFADVGHGLDMNREDRVTRQGLGAMSGKDLGRYLDRLVGAPVACCGVASIDARQWLDFHPQMSGSPRIESLKALQAKRARSEPRQDERGAVARSVLAARAEERASLMEEFVRGQVAKVLRMSPAEIEPRAPLRALGVDSLMALELRNHLEKHLAVTLPATLVFTYPHVVAVAQHLLSKIDTPVVEPNVETKQPASAPSLGAADASLSDEDDALAELDRELSLAKG